jgi:UDP-3-O-[3-hydroxymyristoyl] glucosamine N-acyltransferase
MTSDNRKSYFLRELAEFVGGELLGSPEVRIRQVATLDNAGPDCISFLANSRYRHLLESTHAAAIIIGIDLRDAVELPRIVCADPYASFARISSLLNPGRRVLPGRHATAVVEPSAEIANDAEVGPLSVIGKNARIGSKTIIGACCVIGDNVVLGDGVRLHDNVTIYADCRIGSRVIMHAGVVIGADGFGIALEEERWIKIPQIGRVIIGDDVEIGANTTIDRGTIDDTVIEDGVKLDNQIQIAHNVHIGAHTAIAACAGVAGSARIGRHCRIGGASGIAGHLTIADRVEISAHTIITKSIYKSGTYTGAYPFEANRDWRRNAAQLRHLSELAERVRALEKQFTPPNRSEKS